MAVQVNVLLGGRLSLSFLLFLYLYFYISIYSLTLSLSVSDIFPWGFIKEQRFFLFCRIIPQVPYQGFLTHDNKQPTH